VDPETRVHLDQVNKRQAESEGPERRRNADIFHQWTIAHRRPAGQRLQRTHYTGDRAE
jgi:hypothetical protein